MTILKGRQQLCGSSFPWLSKFRPYIAVVFLFGQFLFANVFGQVPDFAWVKQGGGNAYYSNYLHDSSVGYSVALDKGGNSLITGYFDISNALAGAGLTNSLIPGMIIAKFDPTGNILWAKSESNAVGYAEIATDDGGNVYVCGNVSANTVPVQPVLLRKYDQAGNLLWTAQSVRRAAEVARGWQLMRREMYICAVTSFLRISRSETLLLPTPGLKVLGTSLSPSTILLEVWFG